MDGEAMTSKKTFGCVGWLVGRGRFLALLRHRNRATSSWRLRSGCDRAAIGQVFTAIGWALQVCSEASPDAHLQTARPSPPSGGTCCAYYMVLLVFAYLCYDFFNFAWCILMLRCLKHSFYDGFGACASCDRVCDRAFPRSGFLRSGTLPCDRLAIAIG